MAGADKARKTAAEAVVKLHRGGYANIVLQHALAKAGLNKQDADFAGAVFMGVAERMVTLDAVLAMYTKRPLEKLDTEVRAILESGLYQMLYMRVPQSAAVNESVKLARAMGKSSAAGFVNAVLRRCGEGVRSTSEGLGTGPNLQELYGGDEARRVQLVYSVSPAVAEAVMDELPGEYDAFFASSFVKNTLCLRVNTLRTTEAELEEYFAKKGVAVWHGGVAGCLYAEGLGNPAADDAFTQGLYHVQGEASQLACACVGAESGMRVLDVCAAPGGKSATLAQHMGSGAGLQSRELHQSRVGLIEKAFARLGIQGAVVRQGDATVYEESLCGQHRVLCDVPCSGLGVLAKKPDLRYMDGGNFDTLPVLQLQILRTAARYVEKGGRLVYSTCTVRRAENGDVVRAFLKENAGFSLLRPDVVPKGADLDDDMMTLWPHRTGMDGFFVAVLQRNA